MRRLLYLALALVLLALTGLAFVRVTRSSAYVIRAHASRIREGMTRAEVLVAMSDLSACYNRGDGGSWYDAWLLGDKQYSLWVTYDSGIWWVVDNPQDIKVLRVEVVNHSPDALDWLLEQLGCHRIPEG